MPIHLNDFCSSDPSRAAIQTPWSEGTRSYATDGRVIVRIPRDESIPERKDAPAQVDKAIFGPIPSGPFTPVPAPQQDDYVRCPNCRGTGYCTCRDCHASHECGSCQGTGDQLAFMVIEGKRFPTRHIRLLHRLPHAQWRFQDASRIYFQFQGGDGIIQAQNWSKTD